MSRSFSNSPSFKILVAQLSGEYDTKGNPIKVCSAITNQIVMDSSGNNRVAKFTRDPSLGTASIQVINADFTAATTLKIWKYTLISDIHWIPVVLNINASAAALATAINNLGGLSATANLDTVTVRGPEYTESTEIDFSVSYEGVITNFAILPISGHFTKGTPYISAPVLV
jgi:hypothetical protein